MSDVNIRSGNLLVLSFGSTGVTTATANQNSLPAYKASPYSTFQAIVSSTTFGALTGTATIQCSNDIWTGTGFTVNSLITTSTSTTVTSPQNLFAAGVSQLNDQYSPAVAVGMSVVGPGIPLGTYVATVTNNGSIVLSAAATITSTNGGASLTFFNNNWVATALGTITLTGTTSATAPSLSDGFTTVAPWKFVRAVISNITGTGATISVLVGI